MSHFSVLVIGNDVERQLQPYHEFECTGDNDEFVQEVDKLEDARAEYDSETETRLKAPDGTIHSYFDAKGNWRIEFSQPDPDAFTFEPGRRKSYVPPGYEEVEVPMSQIRTFSEYLTGWYGLKVVPFGQTPDTNGDHRFGYVLIDESGNVTKAVKRTNPNKEWDWWVVGGRWSGFLKLKDGATGARGRLGLMGACADDGPGRADVAYKGDVDFNGMRDAAGKMAGDRWDKATTARGDATWHVWEHVRGVLHAGDIEAARQAYHAQIAMKAVAAALDNPWDGVDEYLTPRHEYIQAARDAAAAPYALVKDGKWLAKGVMAWFGISNDHVSEGDWNRKVNELLDNLPDDTIITVVDCHI
ncbi:hypothetical protein [Burkholderia lata]|uniref:hypothetical protein n=1 Tax=Burkholderia lata (strain ATCC 17760 / DSM 23089 / LMG 22485 / NCIMB 9086 / R18194 / 383) TaxID=482957 RepID=UPI001452B205|nr:hypothetical protein [Burkholderia lata]VWB97518.1 hypothetical protein BLA15816_04711 [Burkholderia lata]